MEHEQAQSAMSDYLEGNLPEEIRLEFEEHLSACPACRKDLELLRRSLKLVQHLPPVEAPADFPLRLRRRARKAGLFEYRQRRRAQQRFMVPFESAMVVIMATVGALVITLLVFQSQMQELIVPRQPTVILAEGINQVNQVTRATWSVGGRVHVSGRLVPQGSPLGAPPELDLGFEPGAWKNFRDELPIEISDQMPLATPPLDNDGLVHIVVQIRLTRAGAVPRGEEGRVLPPGRGRSLPGRILPPRGDKE